VIYKFFFLFAFSRIHTLIDIRRISGNCAVNFYKVNIPNRRLHSDDLDICCRAHNSENQSKCLTITSCFYWKVINEKGVS